ncbi:MAG: ATP-binding protein [Ottowia sp.]|nr:ATP-binding protein [Ottowia sp.]
MTDSPSAYWRGNDARAAASNSAARLWSMLMMARILLAVAIVATHTTADRLAENMPGWTLWASIAYLMATLATRLLTPHRIRSQPLGWHWLHSCGVDLLYFGALLLVQLAGINYAPLLVLPVLTAAVLGSRALALGTAALAALLVIGAAYATEQTTPWLHASVLFQAGVTGAGLLALAWLINHLVQRTVREQKSADASRSQAQLQTLVNNLVIEAMSDGVLIVDSGLVVRSANPAARELLGSDQEITASQFSLSGRPSWTQLADIAKDTLAGEPLTRKIVDVQWQGSTASRMLVRTERTPPIDAQTPGLCVMFLQDLRAIEAQMRAEKLASMGRMSAAVAHELRNPLAAISQANALLDEDLEPEAQERMRAIVAHNARRLERIVDDILDVSRVQVNPIESQTLILDHEVEDFCAEWSQQNRVGLRLALTLQAGDTRIQFVRDHLRRLLVNLLDNAARYASDRQGAIQVVSSTSAYRPTMLLVWSDGAPMEAAVQRHLFEPFFSSESRSSGLGLFICRQLCEQHEATISYDRTTRRHRNRVATGNEFEVRFRRAQATPATLAAAGFATMFE